MRIVDVNEFYAPKGGGVRTYVDRKMAIMAELGHELIVLAPGRETRVEERPGGRIVYVEAPPLPFDRNYGMFWDADPIISRLDALDADVVECSSPWRPAWIVAGWQGRALKAFFMHNDNVETYPKRWFGAVASPDRIERAFAWYNRYMQRFLARFDTVVANGPAVAERMTSRGVRVDATIALGIEQQHFSPSLRDDGLRAQLLAECGLPPEGRLLLGVGRHHREKRYSMVIDAVDRAGQDIPLGLVLLGRGNESKALAKQVGDSPHTRLFAPVYDRLQLARLMASCDAFIHGCETETFGLVVAEALASGAPLIVPDAGGGVHVAAPAYSETFVARDGIACAEAIQRLFARDQAALRRAAANAAASIRTDREHVIDLIDHYAAMIDAQRSLAA